MKLLKISIFHTVIIRHNVIIKKFQTKFPEVNKEFDDLITYLIIAIILYGGMLVKKPLLKILLGAALKLEEEGWRILTYRWIGFFIALASTCAAIV